MTAALACALVVALDQGSKWLALRGGSGTANVDGGLVRIRVIHNRRPPLPIFRRRWATPILWALTIAALAAMSGLPFVAPTHVQWALGATAGGVSGNAIDRIWRGGVVDFVDLRIWPVFNLADVAITGGVIVLAAALLI